MDSVGDFLSSLKNLEATDMPKAGMAFSAVFGYLDSLFHKQYFESTGRVSYVCGGIMWGLMILLT